MKYKITLNGRTYEVEVEAGKAMLLDEYEAIVPAVPVTASPAATPVAPAAAAPVPVVSAPSAPVITGAGDAVTAPMPGTILKINVTTGQLVKEGDVLMILEAMKMENEITAAKNGTVTQVIVSKGATVDTGAPLVILA